jgi:GntR family transcriptional regulator
VQNTPVADPERQPFPGGTVAELYSVGLIVTRVLEEVLIRQPTPPERRELSLETAGPVMEVTRVFYVGERPVECSIAVVDAMSYRLSFETELS